MSSGHQPIVSSGRPAVTPLNPLTLQSQSKMEKCLFVKHVVELPEVLTEDMSVFLEVVSADTWQHVLTDTNRRHLLKFLPSFPENDVLEKQSTLRELFTAQNFKFGSPLKQFHKKFREGMYSPDIARFSDMCRKAKVREYGYQQQVYYSNLLKEVLINRQRILEEVYKLPPHEPLLFKFEAFVAEPSKPNRSLNQKVKRKYKRLIREINQEFVGQDDTSSEDEDYQPGSKGRKQLKTLYSDQSDQVTGPNVLGTFETPQPALMNGNSQAGAGDGGQDVNAQQQEQQQQRQKRAASPMQLTDDDLQEMLHRHKMRKLRDEDHPELDTRGIRLEDIITRTQTGKKNKATKGQQMQKKLRAEKRKKLKQEQQHKEMELMSHAALAKPGAKPTVADESALDGLAGKEQDKDTDAFPFRTKPARLQVYSKFAHFFAVLRDFISVEPEGRINTVKVEEKVREWQESPYAALNHWITAHHSWLELVPSALKFLSGDVLGLTLENFVPYLDYKERAQQWKWIGQGRDSDQDLAALCAHWLDNKDHLAMETVREGATSPPPPRVRTTYVVRPSNEEEKSLFAEQEHMRFDNPHRSFTYCLHGYEAVVGPVKGVYVKDSAMNKAREHALLVNDRPAYVTILTLVRDAAARLPNGEGTRSDICELLKDSSFLAPGITDAQINTVVSGALDRLHYEKDPCVKYDVNRKLWIYLHRNRTEDEFEKIHQAQGAAAKAKKSLQKPKLNKVQKAKECTTGGTSAALTTSPAQQPAAVLSSASNDSFINVETLSPVSVAQSPKGAPLSPRTPQMSPKIIQLTSPKAVGPKSPPVVQVQSSGKPAGLRVQLTTGGQQRVAQILQRPQPRQVTPLTARQVTPSPHGASPQVVSGGKPVAISLIQSQPGAQFVEGQAQTLGAPRTVVLSSKDALSQKIMTAQQQLASGSQNQMNQAQNQPQLVATSPALVQTSSGLSDQGPVVVTTAPARLVTGGGKPVVTRIVQQGGLGQKQVVSFGSLVVGGAGQKQGGSVAPTTIKIQGGNVLQSAGGKPVQAVTTAMSTGKPVSILQRAQSVESSGDSKPATPTPDSPAATLSAPGTPTLNTAVGGKPLAGLAQTTVRGGKPTTVMLTRTVTPPGTRPRSTAAPAGATIAQVLQSAALGAKPASVGGKPIILGGKPAVIGGKPIQLSGKPLQVVSKQGQIGFVQGQLSGTVVSAVNIASQASGASIAVSGTKPSTVTQSSGPSLVSQILQSGTAVLQPASKVAATPRAVTATTQPQQQQQTRMVAPPAGGIVVTQLPQAAQGTLQGTQAKSLPGAQTGLIGAQIIMQAPGGATRIVNPQQLLAAGSVRPTIVTAPGGKPHNIQLVRAVSQPGGKPGQTTLLLRQQGGQAASSLTQSTQQPTVKTVTMTQGPGAPAKAKGGPVYARIITPPPGLRLAAVRPGQVSGGQGGPVTVVQTVSRLAEGQPQVMTVTTAPAPTQVEEPKDAEN